MQNITTVVINCAGMGTRLGMGVPKSLIKIGDKPLIHWQLELLKEVEDIRIVVGFQALDIIKTVREIRNDITFVLNKNFSSTQTGYSLGLGAQFAREYVISLDGDLLVQPKDWAALMTNENEVVGVCPTSTEDPVCAVVDEFDNVISFSRTRSSFEWTGLLKLKTEKIPIKNCYVYELIEGYLPLKKLNVQCCEIDTPSDYDKAIEWVNNFYLNK